MKWLAWFVGLAMLGGCDYLIKLQEHPPPPDAPPQCPTPPKPDGLDADGDGVINELDPCPFVANELANDEDDDGELDDCDLCPQLADDLAGDDPDCDGIGAACDPDSTKPHVRDFYGLSTTGGLVTNNVVFEGDVARLPLSNTSSFSALVVPMQIPIAGTFETQLTIRNFAVMRFTSATLAFEQAGTRYEIGLFKAFDNAMALRIARTSPGPFVGIAASGLPPATDDISIRLRVVLDGELAQAFLTIDDTTTMVEGPIKLTGTMAFAMQGYRDPDAAPTTTTVLVDYLSRIVEAP